MGATFRAAPETVAAADSTADAAVADAALLAVSPAVLVLAAAVRPRAAPERPLGAFVVLGAEACCVASAVAGLSALAVCAVLSLGASAVLGLRAAVPREVERLEAVFAVLLAVADAEGADVAVSAASGVATASCALAEISLEAAAVFLLLAVAGLVVLPALRLDALAAAVVFEAEALGVEAGAFAAVVSDVSCPGAASAAFAAFLPSAVLVAVLALRAVGVRLGLETSCDGVSVAGCEAATGVS